MRHLINVTKLTKEEWRVFKAVRLMSLADAPTAFKITYEEALVLNDGDWQKLLEHEVWFVASSDNGPVGLAGIKPIPDDSGRLEIVGMWVEPLLRGTGVSQNLLDAAIDYLTIEKSSELWASIFQGNEFSLSAFERMGFVFREAIDSPYRPGRRIDRLALSLG